MIYFPKIFNSKKIQYRKKFSLVLQFALFVSILSLTSCGKYGKLKLQNNENNIQQSADSLKQKEQERRKKQKIENQLKYQELNQNQSEISYYDNDFNF